jgi:UDP-N-acetylmuramoyl-L-alanyl-D-glutamate--2,6-diaminopimelate ligase
MTRDTADTTDTTDSSVHGADATGLTRLRELVASGVVIDAVVHDSRRVEPGSMYACLRGEHFDGHDFAGDAVRAGATALLTDHRLDDVAVAQIVVDDTRRRLGPIAAEVAGHPSRALTTVGITGTNGKTTTAALMAAILDEAGLPCGVVGTLHGVRTTPEAPELQAVLRDFVATGRTAAALEVSSHALAMHRVDGTEFDAVVFTNLGHDHLDLHGSQEEYFRAKARLFSPAFSSVGVVNVDDAHGRLLADTLLAGSGASELAGGEFRVVTFGVDDAAELEVTATSHRYRWRGRHVEVPLGGDFNVANSLAALTTAAELGIDLDAAVRGVAQVPTVPGRFEVVDSEAARRRGVTVVIDYAHTPDGLERLLDAARRIVDAPGSLVVVFGCGGRRDRAKRPAMGAVAGRGADRVVVTSDNPRDESPAAIVEEIVAGVEPAWRSRVTTIVDRRDAIGEALASARRGDVVVIAGKGHETTQEFADHTIEFDDRVVAREFLEGRP